MSKSSETYYSDGDFSISESSGEDSPPKDRYEFYIVYRCRCRFIYVIFFFIGAGTLLPWNFLITATQVQPSHCETFLVFSISTKKSKPARRR